MLQTSMAELQRGGARKRGVGIAPRRIDQAPRARDDRRTVRVTLPLRTGRGRRQAPQPIVKRAPAGNTFRGPAWGVSRGPWSGQCHDAVPPGLRAETWRAAGGSGIEIRVRPRTRQRTRKAFA